MEKQGGVTQNMANIKSAAKRVITSRARNARNKSDKSALKTTLKKFDAAVLAGGDGQELQDSYRQAVKAVDQAVAKGLIHKNKAARKKSQLASKLNAA